MAPRMMVESIAAMLPDDASPELRTAVIDHLGQMDLASLVGLMGDALAARAMLDDGDVEGARMVMATYRLQAEAAGLGPLFDAMLGPLVDAQCACDLD